MSPLWTFDSVMVDTPPGPPAGENFMKFQIYRVGLHCGVCARRFGHWVAGVGGAFGLLALPRSKLEPSQPQLTLSFSKLALVQNPDLEIGVGRQLAVTENMVPAPGTRLERHQSEKPSLRETPISSSRGQIPLESKLPKLSKVPIVWGSRLSVL